MARQAPRRLSGGSVRRRSKVSRREDRFARRHDGFPSPGSYYGYATGIVGLRLFPNPDFDEAAAKNWDPKRYYDDSSYYNYKDLVKPYRVGMSCGFCHVGPNPINPPADPENPKWENLSSNVGAQYFWIDRIFTLAMPIRAASSTRCSTPRGRVPLDTSLVSTDNINNPRTMNAVYGLGPRLEQAKRWGKETLGGGSLDNKQFNDFVTTGPLTEFFQAPATVWSPRVLKDGADSVGALGALESGVPEHRTLQRGVAAAFQRAGRWQTDIDNRDRRRTKEFDVLGSDRAADCQTWRCSFSRAPRHTN